MQFHDRLSIRQIPHIWTDLISWSEVPELADVSGIGRYEARFDWSVDPTIPIELDLGRVEDAYEVSLNGTIIDGFDRLNNRGSVAGQVSPGENSQYSLVVADEKLALTS